MPRSQPMTAFLPARSKAPGIGASSLPAAPTACTTQPRHAATRRSSSWGFRFWVFATGHSCWLFWRAELCQRPKPAASTERQRSYGVLARASSRIYRAALEQAGLVLCGQSPDGQLVEAVELREHPFYVGVQYHPEFKSRPNRPHPLFLGFLRAALTRQKGGQS